VASTIARSVAPTTAYPVPATTAHSVPATTAHLVPSTTAHLVPATTATSVPATTAHLVAPVDWRTLPQAGFDGKAMVWLSMDRLWERPIERPGQPGHTGVRCVLDRRPPPPVGWFDASNQ
jgi:hypothetical protein